MSVTTTLRMCVQSSFLPAVGGLMVAAAGLKGHQIAYFGMPAVSLVRSVPLSVLLVVVEFAVGIWLLTGLHQRATRVAAMVCFFGLMQAALWLALTGRKSCGCLGLVDLNPWLAVGLDLGVLAGLALLRVRRTECTIQSHPLRFCGYVMVLLTVGIPACMMMTVFRREASKSISHDLRRDRLLNETKLLVDLQRPTASELVDLVARRTGLRFSVDGSVLSEFTNCQPPWRVVDPHVKRGWAALEAVSKHMSVPARWIKSADGYILIADNPLQRAKAYWFTSLLLGTVGCGGLAWRGRQDRSRSNSMATEVHSDPS